MITQHVPIAACNYKYNGMFSHIDLSIDPDGLLTHSLVDNLIDNLKANKSQSFCGVHIFAGCTYLHEDCVKDC